MQYFGLPGGDAGDFGIYLSKAAVLFGALLSANTLTSSLFPLTVVRWVAIVVEDRLLVLVLALARVRVLGIFHDLLLVLLLILHLHLFQLLQSRSLYRLLLLHQMLVLL